MSTAVKSVLCQVAVVLQWNWANAAAAAEVDVVNVVLDVVDWLCNVTVHICGYEMCQFIRWH